ncbi:MAG: hypothetical protein QOD66_2263 [Solirubrobacteraceae bacterium]|jgi:hypothetical protein|nr:hypothetical protein [Solirubrobacteraceae bacterium]
MHVVVGLLCLAGTLVLLAEFFVVFLLPRRVKRDPRIARGLLRSLWVPWKAIGRRLPKIASDTMLGIFGPFWLLMILGVLSVGVILCYWGMQWAASSHFGGPHPATAAHDLYFSAAAFFSASTSTAPTRGLGQVLQVAEAATGFAVLFISIGYLPALFTAFSRREAAVSRLDPRAGSPPTACALLERSGQRGGWPELDAYLREWEVWTAELMETHLSYPILGYFRSQHVNQNWLAALTTIVDACAYAIAYGPQEAIESSELTFRIGRHALSDLAFAFRPRRMKKGEARPSRDRLTADALSHLRRRLEGSGLHVEESSESRERLDELRGSYEPFAATISDHLALELPDWVPGGEVSEDWLTSPREHGQTQLP